MDQHDQLLGLLQLLYAAPGTRNEWMAFLSRLCDVAGAACVHFLSVDRNQRASVSLTVRTDPAALDRYAAHWGSQDPWGWSSRLKAALPGEVLADHELIPRAAFVRTEYYNEFARHFDLVRGVIGKIETQAEAISVISVGRGERRGPFGVDETRLLRALMPHLRRALQLHRRFAAVEGAVDDFRFALDLRTHAVLLVDAGGRVVFMNDAAVRLTAARDGLSVDAGELRAASDDDTARLRRLLHGACESASGRGVASGGTLIFGRPSGRRALVAVVAPHPVTRALAVGVESACAVVIVADPERAKSLESEAVAQLLHLTAAESRLVALLGRGLTLEQAARHLGLRRSTVRTRLKSVFAKTGVRRQAELVRLAGTPLMD